jgi:LPXTG-site transpeptidase (sortase) family protein
MDRWTDLHKKHTYSTITLVKEVFNTSHDIFELAKKEEEKLFDTSSKLIKNLLKTEPETPKKSKKKTTMWRKLSGAFHFVLLTNIIFFVLLVISNWSAYSTFAGAFLSPEKLQNEQKIIEGNLEKVASTSEGMTDEKKLKIQKVLQRRLEKSNSNAQELGVDHFDQDVPQVTLSVNVTPYEDRIVIPKIGKNIPLVNVEHHDASNSSEWHKIFMQELEKGIIKYPGSADPGQKGNSFIFGHSSNYPWAKGEYNDVFALLNELDNGDEIIVYFEQKKFVYVVKDKKIVKPGHVSSLGGTNDMSQLTLMTCWPLGTTLNRLLVITELKEQTNILSSL